jgi:hypothetical protein
MNRGEGVAGFKSRLLEPGFGLGHLVQMAENPAIVV